MLLYRYLDAKVSRPTRGLSKVQALAVKCKYCATPHAIVRKTKIRIGNLPTAKDTDFLRGIYGICHHNCKPLLHINLAQESDWLDFRLQLGNK
jgi:hypothetical protein